MPDLPPDQPTTEIDWDETRRHLKASIRSRLDRVTAEDLDDLASEAAIRLLRALRRDRDIRNLPGLVSVIAQRTSTDHIRRKMREKLKHYPPDSLQALSDLSQTSIDDWDDRVQATWFLMLEFFGTKKAPCRDLALSYIELGNWNAVAEARGVTCDRIRQQWSRCFRLFREELERSPGSYRDWVGGDA